MATKKTTEIEELIDNFDGAIDVDDPTTVRIAETRGGYRGPMVMIYLPAMVEEGSGVKVDQFEHVTIANEDREEHYKVKCGVHVDVPVPVFAILKESGRYPNL